MYNVYVKTDEKGRITAINSDMHLDSLEGWTMIDGGTGDKYKHAQNNYIGSLLDDRGLFLYELKGGKLQKRKAAEIEADYTPPTIGISLNDRLKAIEDVVATIKKLLGVKE